MAKGKQLLSALWSSRWHGGGGRAEGARDSSPLNLEPSTHSSLMNNKFNGKYQQLICVSQHQHLTFIFTLPENFTTVVYTWSLPPPVARSALIWQQARIDIPPTDRQDAIANDPRHTAAIIGTLRGRVWQYVCRVYHLDATKGSTPLLTNIVQEQAGFSEMVDW